MDTTQFLRRILPTRGLYFIARHIEGKFRHQVCDSIEDAAAYALQFDAAGVPTYHACAAYRDEWIEYTRSDGTPGRGQRRQDNVRAVRSFWLDLDIDPENAAKYPNQEAAVDALLRFCGDAALPVPLVVSSGFGIHCYWTLTDEINPDTWKHAAESLKALCVHYQFKADPACTADAARVLRSVGTWNRKDPANPRPVELVADADAVEFAAFSGLVQAALKSAGVKPPDTIRARESADERINAAFAIQRDFPPCSAHKVADRCQQFAQFRDKRGNIPEPFWYLCLQLSSNTIEGPELAHEWSSGYAGYSSAETARKLTQVRDMGPPMCHTFEARNPGGCNGCPFQNKISSPAQLGAHVENAPAPVIQTLVDATPVTRQICNPPPPFTRTAEGIFMEEEGILHRIYEYDIYPTDIVYDEALGYEVCIWRHWLPKDGWKDSTIKSSLLAKPADFEVALRDVGIQPLIRNRFLMFGDNYLRKLRTEIETRKLFKAMGWKGEGELFVLGDRAYARGGSVIQAGHSSRATGFLQHFSQRGALEPWRDLTMVFRDPTLGPLVRAHQFMLQLAFAAPLLYLAGRNGFTVSAIGPSGVGKSTMGRWMASVYGHPDETWASRETTMNALIERIGAYHALPAYMDEVTTIDAKDLRNLVYMIATGKGKDALDRERKPRAPVNWKTILVCSTNNSLLAKLQMENQAAEGELMRLLEFDVPRVPAFVDIADEFIHKVLNENYGVAGGPYIAYIMAHQDEIRRDIDGVIKEIRVALGMDAKERFWLWAAALAVYGGRLAVKAGVIDHDPDAILPWLLDETAKLRQDIEASRLSSVEVLGQFLDMHVGERLVMASHVNADFAAMGTKPTRGALSQRYERDSELLWIDKHRIETWLKRNHFNPRQIKEELSAMEILQNPRDQKKLGAFTDLAGKSVACWRITMNHEALRKT